MPIEPVCAVLVVAAMIVLTMLPAGAGQSPVASTGTAGFTWSNPIFFQGASPSLAASTAPAQAGKGFVMKTYTYKTVGDLKIEADVYRADDAQPRPVVAYLHGGALIMGGRKGVFPDLRDLCRTEGYCLVSADYRLAPEVKLPQIIEDLRDFIKWLSEKGPDLFHADAGRIVVVGQSAGGYLTMMAGLCRPRPKALVSYWGYGDVDGPWYTQPSEFYRKTVPLISREKAYQGMGLTVSGSPLPNPPARQDRGQYYHYLRQNGLWTKEVTGFDPATEGKKLYPYCPVRNVTAEYPPILMIHGTKDTDVPYQESADMAAVLKRSRVPYELITVAGAGHVLAGGDKQLVAQAYARAREFIKANLGSGAASQPTSRPAAGSP
jgi:acetyl esterase/lipase